MSSSTQPKGSGSKKKVSSPTRSKIDTLTELFPEWTEDDLIDLVQEYDDLETIIDKITSGAVARWDEVKKPSKKDKQDKKEHRQQHPVNVPPQRVLPDPEDDISIAHSNAKSHSPAYNNTNSHSNSTSNNNRNASSRSRKGAGAEPSKSSSGPASRVNKSNSSQGTWGVGTNAKSSVVSGAHGTTAHDVKHKGSSTRKEAESSARTSEDQGSSSNLNSNISDAPTKKMSWADIATPKKPPKNTNITNLIKNVKNEPLENVDDLKAAVDQVSESEQQSGVEAEKISEDATETLAEEQNKPIRIHNKVDNEQNEDQTSEDLQQKKHEDDHSSEVQNDFTPTEETKTPEVLESAARGSNSGSAQIHSGVVENNVPSLNNGNEQPESAAAANVDTNHSTNSPAYSQQQQQYAQQLPQGQDAASAAALQQYYMYQNQFPGYSYPAMFDGQGYAPGYNQPQYQYPGQPVAQVGTMYGNQYSVPQAYNQMAGASAAANPTDVYNTSVAASSTSPATSQAQTSVQQPYAGGMFMPHYGHFYQQSFPYNQAQYGLAGQYPYQMAAAKGGYNYYNQYQGGQQQDPRGGHHSEESAGTQPGQGQQPPQAQQQQPQAQHPQQQGQAGAVENQAAPQPSMQGATPQQTQLQQYYQYQQQQQQQQQASQQQQQQQPSQTPSQQQNVSGQQGLPYGYGSYDYNTKSSRGFY